MGIYDFELINSNDDSNDNLNGGSNGSPNDDSNNGSNDGSNDGGIGKRNRVGMIIGICIGCVGFIAIIILISCYLKKKGCSFIDNNKINDIKIYKKDNKIQTNITTERKEIYINNYFKNN